MDISWVPHIGSTFHNPLHLSGSDEEVGDEVVDHPIYDEYQGDEMRMTYQNLVSVKMV